MAYMKYLETLMAKLEDWKVKRTEIDLIAIQKMAESNSRPEALCVAYCKNGIKPDNTSYKPVQITSLAMAIDLVEKLSDDRVLALLKDMDKVNSKNGKGVPDSDVFKFKKTAE